MDEVLEAGFHVLRGGCDHFPQSLAGGDEVHLQHELAAHEGSHLQFWIDQSTPRRHTHHAASVHALAHVVCMYIYIRVQRREQQRSELHHCIGMQSARTKGRGKKDTAAGKINRQWR